MIVACTVGIVEAIITPVIRQDSLPLPGSKTGVCVVIGSIARQDTKKLPHELKALTMISGFKVNVISRDNSAEIGNDGGKEMG